MYYNENIRLLAEDVKAVYPNKASIKEVDRKEAIELGRRLHAVATRIGSIAINPKTLTKERDFLIGNLAAQTEVADRPFTVVGPFYGVNGENTSEPQEYLFSMGVGVWRLPVEMPKVPIKG